MTNYAYDALGNLTAQQDVRGSVTTYEYDAANRRVAQVADAGGTVILTRSYDAFGAVRYAAGMGSSRLGYTGEL